MKTLSSVLVALALVSAPPHAGATSGTCTITQLISDNNLNLPFDVSVAVGVAMPVEFDESAGTFAMKRDAWSSQFGPNGAQFDTGFGPHGFIVMDAGTVNGSIDASGNVTLPKFALDFATDFCLPRSPNYPILPDLSTSSQSRVATGQIFTTQGVPLDFGTGQLTLDGEDLIPNACGAPGPILSGMRMTCTLSPIPDRTKLPAAPSLAGVAGLGKIGPSLPTTPPKKPFKADQLALKARLVSWPSTIDFTSEDVLVRIGTGGADVVFLRVPAGKFQKKGKKSSVQDKDGSAIVVFTGAKDGGSIPIAAGGTITIVEGKKGISLKLKVQGLDLSNLTGTETLTLAVGSYSASANVTVQGTGKSRKFH